MVKWHKSREKRRHTANVYFDSDQGFSVGLAASENGRNRSIRMQQSVALSIGKFDSANHMRHPLQAKDPVWLQLISCDLELEDVLPAGSRCRCHNTSHSLYTHEDSVAVFIDHQPQMNFGVADIHHHRPTHNISKS